MFKFKDIPKFVINLKRRPDRLETVQKEFDKYNLDVSVWAAIDWRDIVVPPDSRKLAEHNAAGIYACALSHISLIKHAKEQNYKYISIWEDDVILSSHFLERMKYIESLDLDFDQFYLGGHGYEIQAFKLPNVYRIKKCAGTYAYILRNTVYDYILDIWGYQWGADEFFDYFIQENFTALIHVPLLVGTYPNYSDVAYRDCDYRIQEID